MFTQEQLDKYMNAAAGDLGPECCAHWVGRVEAILENSFEIIATLKAIKTHGISGDDTTKRIDDLLDRLCNVG